MLNELNPNAQPARRDRAIGAPEVAFGVGFIAAVAGLALVSVAVALFVAGVFVMYVAWRLS